MNLISMDELRDKLANKHEFKLAFVLNKDLFNLKHIPGSIQFDDIGLADTQFRKDEEIVVYCTGLPCVASRMAYDRLERKGFVNVWLYEGGLSEWEDSGLPIEKGDAISLPFR